MTTRNITERRYFSMPIPQKAPESGPKTARERIYQELRQWIIDGTLKPDERISDQEISQYFSVSRTPVREAMQLLADQKLINIYPGRESRVSPIDFHNARTSYRIAAELHAMAVEFAYPKITESILNELKAINDSFFSAGEQNLVADEKHYDQQFHGIFLTLADNYFLTEFTMTLGSHIERIENLYYSIIKNYKNSVSEHAQIIASLEQKDIVAAKETMRYNWMHTLEILDHTIQ